MKIHEEFTIVVPIKNEEKNLGACLERLKKFNHVVVVDSNSSDSSKQIFDRLKLDGWVWRNFAWNGMFPKKRNWILQNFQWRTKWLMFLDADELLTDAWINEVETLLTSGSLGVHDAYVCYYDNWFMGRMLRHGDVMRKTAVLMVGKGAYERIEEDHWSSLDMEIHEHLVVDGSVGKILCHLEHRDMRSLENYYAKHEEYANWEANRYKRLIKDGVFDGHRLTRRQRIKYSLIKNPIFGFVYFCGSYFLKGGFLDGSAGLRFALGKWRYFKRIRKLIGSK